MVNSILSHNAQLAEEKKPPMSMTDLELWVPKTLRSIGGGPVTMPDAPPPDLFSSRPPGVKQNNFSQPMTTFAQPRNTYVPQQYNPVARQKTFNVVSIGKLELCSQFNASTCPRNAAANAKSCKTSNNKELLHRCSYKDAAGQICGRDHPRSKHT